MNLLMPLFLLALPLQEPPAAAIAPVIGDDVAVVVHVDLMKWKPEPFLRRVLGKVADEEDLVPASKLVGDWVDGLKKAGAKEVFVLIDPSDMPGAPVVVVPLARGADAAAITKLLLSGGPFSLPAAETLGGLVVGGSPASLTRLHTDKPQARPEVLAALAAGKEAAIQVVIAPGVTLRRAMEEAMPALPPQLGGGPITTVSKGLLWASLAMDFEPKSTIHVVVQARDADAAKGLQKLSETSLEFLAKVLGADKNLADLSKPLGEMKPQTRDDRVTMEVDLEKTAALVAVPIQQAREAGRRSQCVNNLKQIGLAMHNSLSDKDVLPPAFKAGKDGKPLLSWRVLILPYIEQKALYDQFHLDEAWDSPHNKTLIRLMPKTYVCPSGSKSLAAEGKTTYLTPRGDGTMYPGAEGIKLQDVTDGTSNTIMVVEAADSEAVIWTKPDDWQVPPASKPSTLFGHHPAGTNFLFADGSIHFIKDTIAVKTLEALLSRKGGEVISADEY